MRQNFTKHFASLGILPLMLFLCSFVAPTLTSAQVQVIITNTNVTCNGLNNGTATATGTNGWAPYTYLWSTGATTQTITGLAPGTYSVTVTDIDLGTGVNSVTITQPPQLGVVVFGESQICGNTPDGKATAVPSGGTPPYTYKWNTGATSAQITGLAAGVYTATVTDANGCTSAASAEVFFWNEGIWVTPTATNVVCTGGNNGGACAMAMSGTAPYTYMWNTGGNTSCISNLAPGTYTVTVTDVNGCSNSTSVVVTQPPALVLSASSTNANCGLQGTATITATGGTPNYTILWSTGATSFTITGAAGTYSATVTDANGCTKTTSATITTTTSALTVNVTAVSQAGCTVGGSATATATGGTGNYAYSWDNGQTTATATNLTAGPHKVTVTDITTGCQGVGTVTIVGAPPVNLVATLVTNATCLTGGSATATASGGTAPYTYLWDNGQTTATATNLSAGPHSVTVTDAKGCVKTAMVTIGQSQGPNVIAIVTQNANCAGTGGSATATATGGTAPYAYLWDNAQTTATATNLSVGPHKVTVTDAAGCAATAMVTITAPNAPTAVISASSGSGCTTGGSATAGASGGTAPYTFKWSNGAMTATAVNLGAGTYTVTVTDAAGCTATAMVSIAAAIPPNVVITASANQNCNVPGSATASATNGATPYIYKWDNGEMTATAVNLSAGTHTVTVTDALGCTSSASVNIGFSSNGIKIGDYVWFDNDQDGFQHPIETAGVPNITVMLIKAGNDGQFGTPDDQMVATTTTNANGMYMINCVTPGTYILMFSGIPAGYEFTGKDKVNNDCKDSDVKSNGKTDPFTIVAGQGDNLCFDAGIHIFCDNVMNAGVVCCSQTICEGDVPAAFYEVQPPAMGTGALEYQWLQLVETGNNGQPIWVGIPGATNKVYQPGPLFETTHYMRCARRAGCTTFLESNIITITVKPLGSPGCTGFTGNFNVQPVGNGVLVSWTTLPEAQAFMYDVEHSADLQTWTNIHMEMGMNNGLANDYDVMDQTPVNGKNYYRIKRTDGNGISTHSVIKSADVSMGEPVQIYPNPVAEKLIVKNVEKFGAPVEVSLLTTNGDFIRGFTIGKDELRFEEMIVTDLPSGLYMVKVRFDDGKVKTVKVTKI